MAKLTDLIFCLRASNVQGEGVSADNILSAITPEYIPGLFTFSVIAIILDIDLSKKHKLLIDFCDPEESIVAHVEGELPEVETESNLPEEYKGVNIALDWNNVNFKRSGLYKITVSIDESIIGEKFIYVKGKNE